MNFFKALFSNKETDKEEQANEASKKFEAFKSDGMVALKTNQTKLAVEFFHKALAIHSDDLECVDYLSQALIAEGTLTEAYEQLQTLAKAKPDNQLVFIRMANVAYMMEDYHSMADACEKAMLIDKDNALVMYLYGRACIGQGDTSNGIAMLSKAILLKNDYYDAYLLRGETLLKNGNVDEAEEDADFLLQHTDNIEDILLLKARIEQNKGNKEEAIKWFGKVIDANPFCIDAFKERAALRKEIGDEVGADEDLKMLHELAHENADNEKVEEDKNFNIESVVNKAYKNNPLGI
jgi:tetratricopeptide (TPR) repeat protein